MTLFLAGTFCLVHPEFTNAGVLVSHYHVIKMGIINKIGVFCLLHINSLELILEIVRVRLQVLLEYDFKLLQLLNTLCSLLISLSPADWWVRPPHGANGSVRPTTVYAFQRTTLPPKSMALYAVRETGSETVAVLCRGFHRSKNINIINILISAKCAFVYKLLLKTITDWSFHPYIKLYAQRIV